MKKTIHLATLLENDLNQAEVVLAAKSLEDELQSTIERLAKLQVNELMPLADRIKETFDSVTASQFEETVNQQIDNLIDSARATKNTIEDQVLALNGEAPQANAMTNELPIEQPSVEDELAIDPAAEMDDFGGADSNQGSDEPLGRSMRESKMLALNNKIKLFQESIKLAKRSKKA